MTRIQNTYATGYYNSLARKLNAESERVYRETRRARSGDRDEASSATRFGYLRQSGVAPKPSMFATYAPDIKGRVKCATLLVASVAVIAVDGALGCVHTVVSVASLIFGQIIPTLNTDTYANYSVASFTSVGLNVQRVFTHLVGIIDPKLDKFSEIKDLNEILSMRDSVSSSDLKQFQINSELRTQHQDGQILQLTKLALGRPAAESEEESGSESGEELGEAYVKPAAMRGSPISSRQLMASGPRGASAFVPGGGYDGADVSSSAPPQRLVRIRTVPPYTPACVCYPVDKADKSPLTRSWAAYRASYFIKNPMQLTSLVSMTSGHIVDLAASALHLAVVVISLVTDRAPGYLYTMSHGYEFDISSPSRAQVAVRAFANRLQFGYILLDTSRIVRAALTTLLPFAPHQTSKRSSAARPSYGGGGRSGTAC
ncbi:MAG: hypothetical protein P0S95_07065 [Rhabdochlamydiaceae bacterium]|nr:hypothetical protein [Candidatus Amphrikana amoebophyrae]